MKIDLNNEELNIITQSLSNRPWKEVEPLMHKLANILEKEKINDNNKKPE